jgi:hypothetical protein
MQYEFQLNSQLEGMKQQSNSFAEGMREDRRDQRIDQQAARQMQMIEQRKEGESFKKFESSGNDIVTGDAGLDQF